MAESLFISSFPTNNTGIYRVNALRYKLRWNPLGQELAGYYHHGQ